MSKHDDALRKLILELVPKDGDAIGNIKLIGLLSEAADFKVKEVDYWRVRDVLIEDGMLGQGRGRGGSVMRLKSKKLVKSTDGNGSNPSTPLARSQKQESLFPPAIEQMELGEQDGRSNPKSISKMKTIPDPGRPARSARSAASDEAQVLSYRHDEKRKNNPQVGMVDVTSDGVEGKTTWKYDPHLDPSLQFDMGRSQIEKIIDDALASKDNAVMQHALMELKRLHSPYLNWTGKAERTSFEVDTVSLHVHERIDPASILASLQKKLKSGKGTAFQGDLFSAPFENLPLREAIDFYKHDRDWSNRLIAGDSLLVMNSLLQKESMAGKVQMIYLDPPYGIKYGSNFQPFVNKRDVKDRKDEDLTQEPEMIKAFRDTWELGIHSYLTYLRDRLILAKDLLSETGSVFVQISEENVHYVRQILGEIFGEENFLGDIIFIKAGALGSTLLPRRNDYLIWYSKSAAKAKYRQIYLEKNPEEDIGAYRLVQEANGKIRPVKDSDNPLTSNFLRYVLLTKPGPGQKYEIKYQGRTFDSGTRWWGFPPDNMERLIKSGRIAGQGNGLNSLRYLKDFPASYLTNVWEDTATGSGMGKVYVVQTNEKVIERCLLMTTDPGDLILDPTCGSGTSAFVAEKWGRRWITCDTSRVAVTLAKQRLMTASYDYYDLRYPQEGLRGGFMYKTIPHVTLKSIANNREVDEIYNRMHPVIEKALAELNAALKGKAIREWEVPFEFSEEWPENARKHFEAYHTARLAMQKQMDASIAAHTDSEILYDQPQISKTKLRITGPFTVEAVPFATVLGLDEAEGPKDADAAVARSGVTIRQGDWRDELLKAGIRGKGGQKIKLSSLETLPGTRYLHAVGTVADTGDKVAVSFGPEFAALEQRQVEIAMREAGDLFPLPKMLVFCAFTFDPEAAKDIDNIKGIQAFKVQMNTDLLTEDLKKARASNESFWLMGKPDVELRELKDGQYQVEVNGFDYFDTKTGELESGGKNKIALWALDTDYDDRSLYPKQIFFPLAGGKEGWYKLRKDIRAELNEDLLEQFHGTKSLPFPAGDNRRIAVKIVDDRGIESLSVMDLG